MTITIDRKVLVILGVIAILAGLVALMICASNSYQELQRSVAQLTADINQYTTATMTHDEVYEQLERESDELGIALEKILEAYLLIVRELMDYELAQRIVAIAAEIARSTGLDLAQEAQGLADGYIYGAIETEDGRLIPVEKRNN